MDQLDSYVTPDVWGALFWGYVVISFYIAYNSLTTPFVLNIWTCNCIPPHLTIADLFHVKLTSDGCHLTSLMIINIGSGDGLAPLNFKSLPEAVLIKMPEDI